MSHLVTGLVTRTVAKWLGASALVLVVVAIPKEAHVSGPAKLTVLSEYFALSLSEGPSIHWAAEGPGDYYTRKNQEFALRLSAIVPDVRRLLAQARAQKRLPIRGYDPGLCTLDDPVPKDWGPLMSQPFTLWIRLGPFDRLALGLSLSGKPSNSGVAWLKARLARVESRLPESSDVANLGSGGTDLEGPLLRLRGKDFAPVPAERQLVSFQPISRTAGRASVELRPFHTFDPVFFKKKPGAILNALPGQMQKVLTSAEHEGLCTFGAFDAAVREGDTVDQLPARLVVSREILWGRYTVSVVVASARDAEALGQIRTRMEQALSAAIAR